MLNKVRSVVWAEHVARMMGDTRVCSKKLKGNNLGNQAMDGRIMLKRISKKVCVRVWTGFLWFKKGPLVDRCEHGNEPSVSIKGDECRDQLYDY
jgi:hypothetical protein